MKSAEQALTRQINHKTMRKIIGAIAFLLAPVTYLLADVGYEITSISATYYTNSGDIFVGSLIVVGFFMAAYNGTGGRDWEFYLSKVAALLAVLVALFPTIGDCKIPQEQLDVYCPAFVAPTWAVNFSGFFGLETGTVHYAAAIPLFMCLFFLLWFFSTRAKEKGRPTRANTYKALAIFMVLGMVAIYIIAEFAGRHDAILWVEIWGLSFFGAGWLLAGSYQEKDDEKPA